MQCTGYWLTVHKWHFCHSMGKHKTANKGGANSQKGTSFFPSSQDGEEGDMLWDPKEEIAPGKEVLSHPNTSPKMPFRFKRTSQLPSERSVSSEHQWDCSPTPQDRRHYCIQVRVILGDRGGNQPPPSHAWGGCLITNILQEVWPEDQVTEAMVLSPGEAILFFSRCSKNKELPYHRARNIEFGLGGPFNWAWRPAQIEALKTSMQEGHHTITKAVVERKMKARGPGWPWGKTRHPRTPAAVYDIKEGIWGLEGVSNWEPKWNDDINCGADQQRDHSQQVSWGWRRHRHLPMKPSGGSPFLGGNSLDGQSEWSSQHSN